MTIQHENITINFTDVVERFECSGCFMHGEGSDGKTYSAYGIMLGDEIYDLDTEPQIEEVI